MQAPVVSAEPVQRDEAVAPGNDAALHWNHRLARRQRLLVFLVLAGLYVAGHLLFRWVEYPLFRADTWYYFGREPPSSFEIGYRFFLTLLPLLAWGTVIFLCLTRFSCLTHRQTALWLILAGLMFFEADMRWFNLSKKHASVTELQVLFSVDPTMDLGLRASDYRDILKFAGIHAAALLGCALLAGPEIKAMLWAVLDGPARRTLPGLAIRGTLGFGGQVACWLRAHRAHLLLDNRIALAAIALCVLADPVIVWALEGQEGEFEESRSVVREVADTNPLRWHSLDRGWNEIVHRFSAEAQDLAAANAALAVDVPAPASTAEGRRCVPNRKKKLADNVLLIQVESLNAGVFAQTQLPAFRAFARNCLRLNRHHASGNCTHYGILGFMHGNPVTFYDGGRQTVPCAYLEHFKDHGYKTRIIARSVLNHHYLGQYVPNWTETAEEIGNDWEAITLCSNEFSRPGPHLAYLFFHHTHYPFYHRDRYKKHQPEVEYEFDYNRSDLILFKDRIVNRYKNCLDELNDWFGMLLSRINLNRTIVVITGDHGEELFEQGRLGHCSSFNKYQTMTPCLVHIPGVAGADVDFTTSHCDIMPTIADALGWETKPKGLGRSLFEDVPYRSAIVANFEYRRPTRWAVVTENRKAIVEVVHPPDDIRIIGLVDWEGRKLGYRDQPEAWRDNFCTVRELQKDLTAWLP